MSDTFTDEEIEEATALAEADEEQANPPKRKSVKIFINPVAFKEDVSINMADLDGAFMTQASLFAHYGMQAAKAAEQMDNLKLLLDVTEAKLSVEHRDDLMSTPGKVTEAMIASAVMTDPRYIRVRKGYNESKGVLEMLKASTEAFRQRRDMLIQLGTNAREERKGEIFIKSKEAEEERQINRNKRVSNG